jgi:hypothetical protein
MQKNLRKSPCSIYFVAVNISSLLIIYAALFPPTLSTGYGINLTANNIVYCRLTIYGSFFLQSVNSFYLFFASVDRILITSSNASTRRVSTRRLAYICIIGATLFWALFHIHALILVDIIQLGPNYYVCYFQPGVYPVFIAYYTLVFAILIPITMAITGLWTVMNIRRLNRVKNLPVVWTSNATVGNVQRSATPKDRQLILMLLIDIMVFIIFSSLMAAYLMEQQITQYETKSYEQIEVDTFIGNVASVSVNIPFCVGFYTHLIVSKTFRSEVKTILTSVGGFCCGH